MNATAPAPAIISCNAALFKAALTFAGNKDVRFYLNGVRIEPSPDGVGVRLIATDGDRLAVLFDPNGHATGAAIVERHKVPAIPKAIASDQVTFNGDYATYPGGLSQPVSYIDGTFPDWQAVIPSGDLSGCVGAFNAGYIADCAVIPKAYGRDKCPEMSVSQRDAQTAALVTFGDLPAFVVVMPLRGSGNPCELPAFMQAGRAERMRDELDKAKAKLANARDEYRDMPRDATRRALIRAGGAWLDILRRCKARGIATMTALPFPPDRSAWHPSEDSDNPTPPVPPAVVSGPPVVRSNHAMDALRRAVTGAIESGTGVAVVEIPATGIESEPVSTGIEDQPVSEPATGVDQMAAIIAHQLEDASPRDLAPIFSHARYAKKSYAVRCPTPDAYKTRAARLAEALRGRKSGRENAYIMPRSKALKLARLWSNGWDACFYSGKLEEPRDNVTRIEPYREAKQRQRARWNATAGTWQPVSAAA